MRVRILLTLFCLGLTAGPSLSEQSQPTDRVERLLEELERVHDELGLAPSPRMEQLVALVTAR